MKYCEDAEIIKLNLIRHKKILIEKLFIVFLLIGILIQFLILITKFFLFYSILIEFIILSQILFALVFVILGRRRTGFVCVLMSIFTKLAYLYIINNIM